MVEFDVESVKRSKVRSILCFTFVALLLFTLCIYGTTGVTPKYLVLGYY